MNMIVALITTVTILILVDGFLQYNVDAKNPAELNCHNPYFSRWFSAINLIHHLMLKVGVTILILVDGFLQFN